MLSALASLIDHTAQLAVWSLGGSFSFLVEAFCSRSKAVCYFWGSAVMHFQDVCTGRCGLEGLGEAPCCLCFLTHSVVLITQAGTGWTVPSAAPVAHGALAVI